jgi:monovalent cation:H+ antiporter-2, CPA2 family
VGFFLRRSLVELYGRGRGLLQETLAQPPHAVEQPLMPALLQEAALQTIVIAPSSPAAGKLIRELELRQSTGASAIVIERQGKRIASPGPDDELLAGDRVLLLGSPAQIEAARRLLLE